MNMTQINGKNAQQEMIWSDNVQPVQVNSFR